MSLGQLVGGILGESLFGATVGLAVAFLLEGVQLAAQALGLQAGYSYASTIDPSTQADTTTLQLMAQLFAGALFFGLGFDRQVLRALARGVPGTGVAAILGQGQVIEGITRLGASIFATGIQLAMPVLALLVLLDVAFAVLGRLHAQLQLLSLAFAIKMLAALAFLASVLAMYPGVFERSGVLTFSVLDRVLSR
jgi:flagellar biosynthetic protein FliR